MSDELSIDNQMTEEQFLAYEQAQELRHEFIAGRVIAMAGGTKNHNRLIKTLARLLDDKLVDSDCEVFTESIKVKFNQDFFYPDVVVDCSEDEQEDEQFAQSPKLIIEVLSPSTRDKDKGTKFLRYINIDSVMEYVVVEPNIPSIEVFRRLQHWQMRHYGLEDTIKFESVDLTVSVKDIYKQIPNLLD